MRALVLILIVLSGATYAQKPLQEVYLKRTIKQEGQQYQFMLLDEDKRGVSRYDREKFYYWYKA